VQVESPRMKSSSETDHVFARTHFPAHKEHAMLYWAIVFFIFAVIASIFGFGGLSHDMAGIAKILFVVFLVVFLITGITHYRGTRRGN
jgi:uncharacterized membrane protein YtjA (UPF0391 family)